MLARVRIPPGAPESRERRNPTVLEPIRLIVVDDHPVVVSGLVGSVAPVPDITVAGVAGSVAEARTLVAHLGADVALLDIRLPDGIVFDVVPDVLASGAAVILYSAFDEDVYIAEAVRRGARGAWPLGAAAWHSAQASEALAYRGEPRCAAHPQGPPKP